MIIEDVQLVKPDLVFLDLWIPKMGGEMATMLVKNNKETQCIPIILFSALDDIETIQKRIKADGFLKKPFDINEIIRLVENKLAGVD